MSKSKQRRFAKLSPLIELGEAVDISSYMLDRLPLAVFTDIILRNENLIVQDGNSEKMAWVQGYIDSLKENIRKKYPSEHSVSEKKISFIPLANKYFHQLFEWRSSTDAVEELTASKLVSASLARAAEDYLIIAEKAKAALMGGVQGKVIDTHQSYLIEDSLGNRVHPDSAMSTLFESVFLILKSTGFIEGFKEKNHFNFIEYLHPNEDELYKISALNINAMSWKYFDTLQKDIRHCNRQWEYSDSNDDVPEEYKKGVKEYLDVHSPVSWRAYEIVAEQRVRQLAKEIYFGASEWLSKNKSSNEGLLNRLSSKVVIEKVLSLDPDDERNKCLGLTLSQWLEGYAVLQDFVKDSYIKGKVDTLIPLMQKDSLIRIFSEKGVPEGIAESFIDNVTFGPSSFDLYDTPLIKFGTQYMVYAPVLKEAMLHELVISNVGRNKEKLRNKGDALEDRLFDLFSESGFQPKKIKEKRKEEEYEFDVSVKWEDFLFVFECKNRAVPRSPVLSRNMMDDYKEHIGQLARLCAGLKKHPDILEKHFGRNHRIKKIVPCIVNGVPLSLDKRLDGVFVTDVSAISRFFNGSEIMLNLPSGERCVYSQWVSSNPTVEDFLFLLNNPFNVKMKMANFSTYYELVPINDGVFVRSADYLYEEKGIQDAIEYFDELESYRNSLISAGDFFSQENYISLK